MPESSTATLTPVPLLTLCSLARGDVRHRLRQVELVVDHARNACHRRVGRNLPDRRRSPPAGRPHSARPGPRRSCARRVRAVARDRRTCPVRSGSASRRMIPSAGFVMLDSATEGDLKRTSTCWLPLLRSSTGSMADLAFSRVSGVASRSRSMLAGAVRTVLAAARSAARVGGAIDDVATKVSTPAAALSVNLRINIGWFSLHSGRRDDEGGRDRHGAHAVEHVSSRRDKRNCLCGRFL